MAKGPDDYEVGYGKPPKHTQFAPGVSGNKGQRKRPETHGEIIARIRDDKVMVGDKLMTKFELAVLQVVNQTIKSGKPRDLKIMFEMLEKHSAIPQGDPGTDAKANADKVIAKIRDQFLKVNEIDPDDLEARKRHEREEAQLIMACPHCGPELKARWAEKEYKELSKRIGKSHVHQDVERFRSKDGDRK